MLKLASEVVQNVLALLGTLALSARSEVYAQSTGHFYKSENALFKSIPLNSENFSTLTFHCHRMVGLL